MSDHLKYEELVVAFANRPTGDLFRKEVLTRLLFGREFIARNFYVVIGMVSSC